MDSNRYGVLAVTVMAVFVAAVAALLTRNSWADKDTSKSSGLSVRLQSQTTTTLSSLSTTSSFVPSTVPLPLPNTSTSARPGVVTTPTTRGTTGTTTATTPTTRPGTPTTATTPTTKGPTGSFDQRSDNDASFPYPTGGSGAQGPTSSKGALRYIVRGQATSASQWTITAEVINNSGREARFDGGIDAVVQLTCVSSAGNTTPGTYHLHNPEVTTMPAGGGVQLAVDIAPLESSSGTCNLYGTVKYTTV